MRLKLLLRYLLISCSIFLLSFAGSFLTGKNNSDPINPMPDNDDDKPAEQVYKNIQVLKGMPSKDLHYVMSFIRVSLGVNCGFCHVRNEETKEFNWESDDKEEKGTARKMISMVMGINRDYFEGFNAVSCFSCHQGKTNVSRVPPIPVMPGQQREFVKDTTLPTAQAILDNYKKAIGDFEKLKFSKSRYSKGTITGAMYGKGTSDFETYQEAPNKYLQIVKSSDGEVTRGFDGTDGWMKDPKKTGYLDGFFLMLIKDYSDYMGDMDLYTRYSKLQVFNKDTANGLTCYMVRAVVNDDRNERLYFDVNSGLLVRRKVFIKSIIGFIPQQIDYADYRNVDGVMMPFDTKFTYVDGYSDAERKLTEVKFDPKMDNISFTMPKQ